jgi:hypothetical protein
MYSGSDAPSYAGSWLGTYGDAWCLVQNPACYRDGQARANNPEQSRFTLVLNTSGVAIPSGTFIGGASLPIPVTGYITADGGIWVAGSRADGGAVRAVIAPRTDGFGGTVTTESWNSTGELAQSFLNEVIAFARTQ